MADPAHDGIAVKTSNGVETICVEEDEAAQIRRARCIYGHQQVPIERVVRVRGGKNDGQLGAKGPWLREVSAEHLSVYSR